MSDGTVDTKEAFVRRVDAAKREAEARKQELAAREAELVVLQSHLQNEVAIGVSLSAAMDAGQADVEELDRALRLFRFAAKEADSQSGALRELTKNIDFARHLDAASTHSWVLDDATASGGEVLLSAELQVEEWGRANAHVLNQLATIFSRICACGGGGDALAAVRSCRSRLVRRFAGVDDLLKEAGHDSARCIHDMAATKDVDVGRVLALLGQCRGLSGAGVLEHQLLLFNATKRAFRK